MAKDAKKIILNVPAHEEEIIEWLNNQSNMNQSIRKLIRDCIQVYGTCDLNELPVIVDHLRSGMAYETQTPKRRPGRPRKTGAQSVTTNVREEISEQFAKPQLDNTTQTLPKEENVLQEQSVEPVKDTTVQTEVQYGTEINTDFSGSFAHNEVANSNQSTQAQSNSNNPASGATTSMKNNLMEMFNGK